MDHMEQGWALALWLIGQYVPLSTKHIQSHNCSHISLEDAVKSLCPGCQAFRSFHVSWEIWAIQAIFKEQFCIVNGKQLFKNEDWDTIKHKLHKITMFEHMHSIWTLALPFEGLRSVRLKNNKITNPYFYLARTH